MAIIKKRLSWLNLILHALANLGTVTVGLGDEIANH